MSSVGWNFVWLSGSLSALAVLIYAAIAKGLLSEVVAAWVQAIGSSAAVLWGVWLLHVEVVRRDAERQERRLASIRAALGATRYAADQIRELVDRTRIDKLWIERLAWADELLSQVRVLEADDERVIDAVVASRSRLKQAERQAVRINNSKRNSTARTDAARQLIILRDKVDADVAILRGKCAGGD